MGWPRYISVPIGEFPRTAEFQRVDRWFYSLSSLDAFREKPELLARSHVELDALREAAIEELKTARMVHVRVISQHKDDSAMRKVFSRVEYIWDWLDSRNVYLKGKKDQIGVRCPECQAPVMTKDNWVIPPMEDAKKSLVTITDIADMEAERDKVRYELFELVLIDKQSKEQIAELMGLCSLSDVMNIFLAAKGISVSLPVVNELPQPSATSQTGS